MPDPAAARQITTLFPLFLGLRLVPAGLWFLALAVPLPGDLPGPLHLALLAVAAAAVWWTHRWYRERFGVVEAGRRRFGRAWFLLGGVAAAYLALALGAGRMKTESLVLLVVLLVFAAGAGYALPRLAAGTGRWVAFALVAALGAALVAFVPRDPSRIGEAGWLLSLAIGLVLCVAGWAEHRSLVSALPAPPEGDDV